MMSVVLILQPCAAFNLHLVALQNLLFLYYLHLLPLHGFLACVSAMHTLNMLILLIYRSKHHNTFTSPANCVFNHMRYHSWLFHAANSSLIISHFLCLVLSKI
jgi:hypothetical protein